MHPSRSAALLATVLNLAVTVQAQPPGVEDLLLKSQMRMEGVMDAPISASVFTGRALEDLSARDLGDLGRFAAGVETNRHTSLQTLYTIRGVQPGDLTAGSYPAVTLYVDGVYAAREGATGSALVDVERVQVLRGPQGVLYGRNALAGAVDMRSQRPGLNQHGRLKLTLGNYDRIDGELIYNQPISDGFSFRLVASSRQREPYLDSLSGRQLNDDEQQLFRLTLLWLAGDHTEFLWRSEYSDLEQNSAARATAIAAGLAEANPESGSRAFGDISLDLVSRGSREVLSSSLEINHLMHALTFTSITGWRESDLELEKGLDGADSQDYLFASGNLEDYDHFSQEFRLSSLQSPLNWTAGFVFSQEDLEQDNTESLKVALLARGFEELHSEGTADSYALYVDASWELTARLNLTGGLRYTYEDKEISLSGEYQATLAGTGPGQAVYNDDRPELEQKQTESWDYLSARLLLDYRLREDTMLYGSVSNGFKSGGFYRLNISPDMDISYDEEELINYEVGFKGQYLDNSLHLGITAFYYEHENLQELQLTGQPAPIYRLHTSDAEGHGAEIEALWLASPRFTLAGNYSYVDTNYSRVSSIDAAPGPWSGTPHHKVNLSLQYAWQMPELGLLIPRLDSTWVDERGNAGSGPYGEIEAFTLTNARITWLPGASNWELALWSTNLFDEQAHLYTGDNGGVLGALTPIRIPPRMYGADFVYHF